MQMAARSSPNTEMYWSMMPQGMPTKLRSALWQRRANSSGAMRRPASMASAEETSSAAEELRPDPSGTVLRTSKLAGATEIGGGRQVQRSHAPAGEHGQRRGDFQRRRGTEARSFRHGAANEQVGRGDRGAGADQLLRHSEGVVGPVAAWGKRGDFGDWPLGRFLAVLRIDAQCAAGRRRGGHVSSQIERHRQHETQVVVGMFADEIDAARGTENADAIRGSVEPPEGVDHGLLPFPRCVARQAISSRKSPNTSMLGPEYRLTLAVVRAARVSGAKTPIPNRMRPSRVKNQPEGTLRSISPKPDIEDEEQYYYDNSQRRGALIPLGGGVVRNLGEAVDQPFHFLVGTRRSYHADHNGDDEIGRKRDDRDPEILRHLRRSYHADHNGDDEIGRKRDDRDPEILRH